MNKLDEIIAHKHQEIKSLIARAPKLRLAALARNDFRSLEDAIRADPSRLALIAEVKKASPSAGIINEDIDPVEQALEYEEAGADAISVLTDKKYFAGDLVDMTWVRKAVSVPVLRKDFMVHEAQMYEASVAGADAVLLIVAALKPDTFHRLYETALSLQLEVLVEVHSRKEMDFALDYGATIIGINNRNLKTFQVDITTTEELAEEASDDVVLISESGIKTAEDAQRVADVGVNALLVGETLMRSDDIAVTVRSLKTWRMTDER